MIMRKVPPLSPEARAFLDQEREVPQLSPAARARSLARARAAILGSGSVLRALPSNPPSKLRWAVAAAVLGAASAAAGASAYRFRGRFSAAPKPVAAIAMAEPVRAKASSSVTGRGITKETTVISAADGPAEAPSAALHGAARASTGLDELRLLRRARAAVAEGDFEGALRPIAEHARRFPDGTLAEEREALRVKSLSTLGQSEEARRAASAFRRRFPHSVLLHVVEQLPTGG